MKILLLNDYSAPTGGAELTMLGLRDELRARGHDARLFASRATLGINGATADYSCFGTTSRFRTLVQTANPDALLQLRRVLAEFRPDVVHVQMFLTQLSPLVLLPLRAFPCICHVAWYRPICPLGTRLLPDRTPCQVRAGAACYRNGCLPLRDWLPLMVQMKLWRRWRSTFDVIVANSEATRRELLAGGIEPVEVIWNGVPVRPPRPSLASPPTAAFAGRLIPEKGVDVLLCAFAKVADELPAAQLLIAGDGPERERLQTLCSSLKLNARVSMLGHLPREQIERAFAAAWVQVVPSRWAEPFGLVAAESMMRGTAVIASGSGGLTEIVEHGRTGLLVPPGDADALAAAMLQVLRDRELAEEMGASGRQRALQHFGESRFVDDCLRLYKRLAGGGVHHDPARRARPVGRAHHAGSA